MISSYYHSQKVQHNQLHATLLVLLIVCLVGVHLIVATPLHALSRTQVESSDVLSGDIAALQAEPEYRMLGSGINIAGFEFGGLTPPKHAYVCSLDHIFLSLFVTILHSGILFDLSFHYLTCTLFDLSFLTSSPFLFLHFITLPHTSRLITILVATQTLTLYVYHSNGHLFNLNCTRILMRKY